MTLAPTWLNCRNAVEGQNQVLSEEQKKYQREWRKKWRENPANRKKQAAINHASRTKHIEKARERDRKRDYKKQDLNRSPESKERRRLHQKRKYKALTWRQKLERRLKSYGMTLDDFDRMWDQQGGNCASCFVCLEHDDPFHIDHDHKTGAVRGILCPPCNLTVGHGRESPDLLRKCAAYLERVKA